MGWILDAYKSLRPDDINHVAKPILRHRIITNFTAEADGVSKEDILDRLIETATV